MKAFVTILAFVVVGLQTPVATQAVPRASMCTEEYYQRYGCFGILLETTGEIQYENRPPSHHRCNGPPGTRGERADCAYIEYTCSQADWANPSRELDPNVFYIHGPGRDLLATDVVFFDEDKVFNDWHWAERRPEEGVCDILSGSDTGRLYFHPWILDGKNVNGYPLEKPIHYARLFIPSAGLPFRPGNRWKSVGMKEEPPYIELVHPPMPFTDYPLRPGVTPIRAVHFTELRTRIDALRVAAGLPRFQWTDQVLRPGVTLVRLVHLIELREALAVVYAAGGRAAPRWTDAASVGGTMPIKAAHLTELRTAVVALE